MIGRKKINASALGYAIVFLLLVGLVATSVLFVSSANKRIETNYLLQEHLLFNNYLSLRFGANLPPGSTTLIPHTSGDSTEIVVRPWGAFSTVYARTFHQHRSIERSAIIGVSTDDFFPSLYVPNTFKSIKVCGDTKLEGTIYAPVRGLERGYIAGKRFTGKQLLDGELKESERHLPPLKAYLSEINIDAYRANTVRLESLEKDSVFRFNEQPTLYSSLEPVTVNVNLTGNIIIHSFDSIFVSQTVRLDHVILIAPIIRFEEGFNGRVQAIAAHRITCEKGVHLDYPSALILREREGYFKYPTAGIELFEDARVIGGILLSTEAPNFRKPLYLGVHHATIGGLVYNQGETELQGTLLGSLYTEQLHLDIGGGSYKGYLMDAEISSVKLPKEFVYPDWLDSDNKTKNNLLTCF